MKGRQLPLNIELEHAAIHACLKGALATEQLHIEELSKTGQKRSSKPLWDWGAKASPQYQGGAAVCIGVSRR